MKEERKWNHSNMKCLIKTREGRKGWKTEKETKKWSMNTKSYKHNIY